MFTRSLPSSALTTYINDQVQVFTGVLSPSRDQNQSGPVVQVSNYVQALRNAFVHLQAESKRVVEGIWGVGTSRRVSPAAQKMKQLIQSQAGSDNCSDELLTWTAILRLREFLEKSISNRVPQPEAGNNPCNVWLSNSAKSQFQACIALVEEELTRVLPATMNASETERVKSIFNSVLKFELALLDSAYARSQKSLELSRVSNCPWHPSNIIFSTDFDVTCTVVDSCEALVKAVALRSGGEYEGGKLQSDYEAVLDRHSQRVKETLCTVDSNEVDNEVIARLSGRDGNSGDLVPGMDPLLKPLFDSTFKSSPDASGDNAPDAPCDEIGLRKVLTKLANLEVLCNQEVMAAGVLSGSTKGEIEVEAKQLLLRENCPRVLQQLVEVGTDINVVSANWSRDLIVGGLSELSTEGRLFVHCNDILFDNSGVCTGVIDMTVLDAFDKEQMLRALRKMYNFEQGKVTDPRLEIPVQTDRQVEKMMVYMGDSYTDILGLLEADLGIVIGQSADARRVMSSYGIQLLPLAKASADICVARLDGSKCTWRRRGVLFEAQGWEDVEACLFGLASGTPSSSPTSVEPLISNESRPDVQPMQLQEPLNVAQELSPVNLGFVQVAC